MKVRKKSPVFDAVQFTDKARIPEGVKLREARWGGGDQSFFNHKYGPIYEYVCDTVDGLVRVKLGWWIVTDPEGKRISCGPETFVYFYEPLLEVAQ